MKRPFRLEIAGQFSASTFATAAAAKEAARLIGTGRIGKPGDRWKIVERRRVPGTLPGRMRTLHFTIAEGVS